MRKTSFSTEALRGGGWKNGVTGTRGSKKKGATLDSFLAGGVLPGNKHGRLRWPKTEVVQVTTTMGKSVIIHYFSGTWEDRRGGD